jgi:hypothetical protein
MLPVDATPDGVADASPVPEAVPAEAVADTPGGVAVAYTPAETVPNADEEDTPAGVTFASAVWVCVPLAEVAPTPSGKAFPFGDGLNANWNPPMVSVASAGVMLQVSVAPAVAMALYAHTAPMFVAPVPFLNSEPFALHPVPPIVNPPSSPPS